MDPMALIGDLAIALGCGAVIGFERGWTLRAQADGTRPAGIRTFSLIGLVGGIAGLAGPGWPLAAAVLAVAGLLGLGYWRASATDADVSLTSVVAGVLAVLLGGAATLGHGLPAAMAAVVATVILSAKPLTHRLLEKVEPREMSAVLRLLLISVVVLPVLPDQGYGPYQALNPFKLWLMVVAISGLSFLGYVAIRLGDARRGVLFAGVFGGLVSSTATTLALARMARQQPAVGPAAAAGTLAAWIVMCCRVILIVYVLDPVLGLALALPMAAMAGAGLLLTLWFLRLGGSGSADAPQAPANPFELASALRFALLLAGIMLVSRWVESRFGTSGLDVLAVISGIADVDAITLSIAGGTTGQGIGPAAATEVIVLAAVTNTIVKAGLGAYAGGRILATRLVPAAVLMTAAAGGALFL
ncbi:MgtC/SapB family protein [Zavarzinia compransoris]|uniref:Uncharacterized protein n=1 Tax=Zavarzinia compransoris TaxID=1264899 RepID=A0A317EBE7_9PROT|nr:MgtC/SapB family protein [Zavarzinia compransoris]PWR23480.1 hypothetical protein DKG75_02605 [Zavarzinia compransoris]TDP45939.1 uncharacterized membrane protein (DUF4010 family) [Zavarzinia compransoris]